MMHPNVVCTYHYDITPIRDDKPVRGHQVRPRDLTCPFVTPRARMLAELHLFDTWAGPSASYWACQM